MLSKYRSMDSFIQFILERLSQFGKIPLCNGIASRAPNLFGFCFPLCYRCTFLFLGFFIALVVCYRYKKTIPIMLSIICLLPMIIDGGLQTFFGIMSTNLRRTLTGGLFGVAMGIIVARIYVYIDQKNEF